MRAFARRLATTFVAALVASQLALANPRDVEALSCTVPSSAAFAGVQANHTNAVRGAKVKIEFVNPALCTTAGGDDFSSYWVAVVGRLTMPPVTTSTR